MWSYDSDAAKWVVYKKVGIASDNVSGLAAHRQFQEFVVFGVTADRYCVDDIDDLSFANECGEEF